MEKLAWDGPKWGQEGIFPANPDIADILGDMDFDVGNSHFGDLFGFQISRFPDFELYRNLAWARLGPDPAGLGSDRARLGPWAGWAWALGWTWAKQSGLHELCNASCLEWARRLSLLIQTLPTFWVTWIWILIICFFL